MQKGISIRLSGANAEDTAKLLVVRLIEMGRAAESVDPAAVRRLGGPRAAAQACGSLVRNGAIAVITHPRLRPEGPSLEAEVDPHDTPEFAAEKILDQLAELGFIALGNSGYSPEEEELIKQRLANLGYIE
jgi:hypothetical protein